MTDLLQTTTSGTDVNPPDPSGRLALGRTTKSVDETEMHDSERDELDRADADRSRVVRAIARRQSMPNGEWAIRNDDELRSAISNFQNPTSESSKALSQVYGADEIQRHIIQRARDLQLTGLLPVEWSARAENNRERLKRMMLQAIENKIDEAFVMTCEQLEAESRDEKSKFFSGANRGQIVQASRFFSAKIRRKYASQGVALPDGSFPIPDKDALRRAIRLVGKGGAAAKRHIIKRARSLGQLGMLPSKWGVSGAKATAEIPLPEGVLVAEDTTLRWTISIAEYGEEVRPLLLEDKTGEGQTGFARIKVPFFVGDSVNRPPGMRKRVKFPTRILQETVLAGNKQIEARTQPLTVYARHAKADSGDDLPVGGIVKLLAEGRIGWAVVDVLNKGEGEVAIGLMQHDPPFLNAVSLRAGPTRFEWEEIEHDGELINELQSLHLDGVDFAPDSPAMPTYGVQVLAAEVKPDNAPKIISEKGDKLALTATALTAENLRLDHPALVEELTTPLVEQIESLREEIRTQKATIASYQEKERLAALDAYVRDLAKMLPEDQQEPGLKLFQEFAAESKTQEVFAARVLPTFTRLMTTGLVAEKKETDEERMAKLWPNRGGNGLVHGITQEKTHVGGDADDEEAGEFVGPLAVPA